MVANKTEGEIVVGRVERLKAQTPAVSVVKRVFLLYVLPDEVDVAIAIHIESGNPDRKHVIDQGK